MVDYRQEERWEMVREQLIHRNIRDAALLEAFRTVPRHIFVHELHAMMAYEDCPVPTMAGQTISQPYIVALMTDLLKVTEHTGLRILEVGGGAGYQSAILAFLRHQVISIERIHELVRFARQNLSTLPYAANVEVIESDGTLGWAPGAPYDRIIVTAAAPNPPPALIDQLAIGGRMVIPCGNRSVQELQSITRTAPGKIEVEESIRCCFVPLLGEDGFECP